MAVASKAMSANNRFSLPCTVATMPPSPDPSVEKREFSPSVIQVFSVSKVGFTLSSAPCTAVPMAGQSIATVCSLPNSPLMPVTIPVFAVSSMSPVSVSAVLMAPCAALAIAGQSSVAACSLPNNALMLVTISSRRG